MRVATEETVTGTVRQPFVSQRGDADGHGTDAGDGDPTRRIVRPADQRGQSELRAFHRECRRGERRRGRERIAQGDESGDEEDGETDQRRERRGIDCGTTLGSCAKMGCVR